MTGIDNLELGGEILVKVVTDGTYIWIGNPETTIEPVRVLCDSNDSLQRARIVIGVKTFLRRWDGLLDDREHADDLRQFNNQKDGVK